MRSLITWFLVLLLTIISVFFIFLAFLFVFPFDRQRKIAHIQGRWWALSILAFIPGIHLKVNGLENIEKDKTYIIVANHQSLADIVLIYKINLQFKWVAKQILFNIPVLGWGMRLAGYIPLSRGKISSIKQAYRRIIDYLRNGMSVVFFPEGTRAEGDKLIDFKNGAFKLAIREKIPILPVTIKGAKNIISKGSWLFETRTDCVISVLPEIETVGLEVKDFGQLRDVVRHKLEETKG